MNYQINDFTLANGEERSFPSSIGKNIKILAATADFKISLNGGKFVPAKLGRTFFSNDGQLFDQVTVKNDSGASNTISFYVGSISLNDENLATILSSLLTSQADIAALKALAHGTNGVTVLKTGTTTKTVNFRGIDVKTDMAIVTITGSNVGTDLNGVTLPVGYHPISGTAIDVTGNTGIAYLITE